MSLSEDGVLIKHQERLIELKSMFKNQKAFLDKARRLLNSNYLVAKAIPNKDTDLREGSSVLSRQPKHNMRAFQDSLLQGASVTEAKRAMELQMVRVERAKQRNRYTSHSQCTSPKNAYLNNISP